MRPVPRTPTRPVTSTPTRGNWTWLVSALVAATLACVALLHYSGTNCQQGGRESLSAAVRPVTVPGKVPVTSPASTPATGPASSPAAGAHTGRAGATRATALFYDPGSAVGSCTLGPFPATGLYVSLPPQRYGKGTVCGSYLYVRGPLGTVRAEVVDLCPGCAPGTINLSRSAFDEVVGTGSAEVAYWPQINPPLPGPVQLRVGTTDSGRVTLQVINNGNPLRSVAIESPGASWQDLKPNTNDFWVAERPLTAGPFMVRITDYHGHQVLLPRIFLDPGSLIRTSVPMYHPGATPGPASTGSQRPAPARSPGNTGGRVTRRAAAAGQGAGC